MAEMIDMNTLADRLQSIREGIDAQHRLRDGCLCAGCGTWAPHNHPEAHAHADNCPEIARVTREQDTRGRLDALISELRTGDIDTSQTCAPDRQECPRCENAWEKCDGGEGKARG